MDVVCYASACVPYDANWAIVYIASFMQLPQWLLAFSVIIGWFSGSWYFTFCSTLLLGVTRTILHHAASYIGVPHPASFDTQRCGAPAAFGGAFPDASYVLTLAYSVSVIVGLMSVRKFRRHVTVWRILSVALLLAKYMLAQLVTSRQDAMLLVANTAVALFTALLFVGISTGINFFLRVARHM